MRSHRSTPHPTPLRQRVARRLLATAALALATMVAPGLTPGASAVEPTPVQITQAPPLTWGFKQTWRDYAPPPQTIGGASWNPAIWNVEWAFGSGSYDAATQTTRLAYAGSVHWQKYRASEFGWEAPAGYEGEADPYVLDVTLSDPQITIGGEGARLSAVLSSRDPKSWRIVNYGRVALVNLDVGGVVPTVEGATTTWSGVPATVSAEGSPAFGGYYQP